MPGANQGHQHVSAQEHQDLKNDPNAKLNDNGDFVVLSDKKEGSAGTKQNPGAQDASHVLGARFACSNLYMLGRMKAKRMACHQASDAFKNATSGFRPQQPNGANDLGVDLWEQYNMDSA